jgi:phytoene synthase
MTPAEAQAMETVRAADRDRYLSALYAPEDRRGALFSLYAFNAEIAAIRDRIREPMPGEIRLQWWREAIASDDPQGHPLAEALIGAIRRHELPRKAFDGYLEARIFDLYDDPMPDRAALEGYCGETASALIQLAALVLDPQAAPEAADAAGHAGCAQAIAGMLRLLPIHRLRGQCYIPRDILTASGTSRDALVSADSGPAGGRAVEAMLALAREHCQRFEAAAKNLPTAIRPAFLSASLAPAYLDAVERLGGRALTVSADIGQLRKQWIMLRRAARGWR